MSAQVTEPTSASSAPIDDSGSSTDSPPDQHEVAIRAYEIYCGRGCEHGLDLDDWLEAERQLREELATELPDPGTARTA